MTDSFPYGYTTECKQKFIYRQLLALNEQGQEVKESFKLPACCKCMIRSSYNYDSSIYSRSGVDATEDRQDTTLRIKR